MIQASAFGQPSMSDLGALLCGKPCEEGIAKSALDQLSRSINSFSHRTLTYLSSERSDDLLTFGPFCARVLLENSCAALVGRLDSFRILYLSEFQTQPEYELSKRVKSSFSWSGDVIPEHGQSNQLWRTDQDSTKISRALFSMHSDHVYWRPAVTKMLDFIGSRVREPELSEITKIDVETYTNETVGRSSQLYSTLSKGVHWEFFTSVLVFDEFTVKSAIRDTCLLVGKLGLISHFVPTAFASLEPNEALESYINFRRRIP